VVEAAEEAAQAEAVAEVDPEEDQAAAAEDDLYSL